MTVTIDLSPEEEAVLTAQARARGVSVEQHLRELAEQTLLATSIGPVRKSNLHGWLQKLFRGAPTFDQYRQLKHFDALDGMRAIAVILVILEHFGGAGYQWLTGWLGVHIFFVMSGFLITTLLLREEERNGRISFVQFYLRRVFRIMPVYYLAVAILIAQTYALGGESWQHLRHSWPYYAAFMNEQHFVGPWSFLWTMGIEWKFYLLWPVILFLFPLTPKRKVVATICTLFVLSRLWRFSTVQPYHYVVLLLGATAAILLHHRRTFNVLRFLMNPVASVLLLVCVAVMQVYGIHVRRIAGPFGGPTGILIYGILVAFFLPTLLGKSPVNRVLESRPFAFVGNRSYSLYLFHFLAAQAVLGMDPLSTGSLSAVLVTVVGLVFADCLYRWVETPMISIGKRLESKWRQRACETEAGPRAGLMVPPSSAELVIGDFTYPAV